MFFGVVSLLLGAPLLGSFQARVPSRLLRLGPPDFTLLFDAAPEVRQSLTEALANRVGLLEVAVTTGERRPIVVGGPFDAACHTLREFLSRNSVAYEWLDCTSELDLPRVPPQALESGSYPMIVLADGTVLSRPSPCRLAEAVGLCTVPVAADYDV